MITAATVILTSVIFYECFVRSKLLDELVRLKALFKEAQTTLMSDSVSDLEKEQVSRKISLSVFKVTAKFIVSLAIIILIAAVPIFLVSFLLNEKFSVMLEKMSTVPMLLVSLLAIVVFHQIRKRLF